MIVIQETDKVDDCCSVSIEYIFLCVARTLDVDINKAVGLIKMLVSRKESILGAFLWEY